MKDDIRTWLNGNRDFAAGMQLYLQYGHDEQFKQRLQGTETPTLKADLFSRLKQLYTEANVQTFVSGIGKIAAAVKAASFSVRQITTAVQTATHAQDKDAAHNVLVDTEKRDADRLYKQLMNTRAQLFALCQAGEDPDENNIDRKNERLALTKQVMSLEQKTTAAYDRYRYALQHGQLPQDPAPTEELIDPIFLPQKISNLRKDISRYRNRKIQTEDIQEKIRVKEIQLKSYLSQYEAYTAGKS